MSESRIRRLLESRIGLDADSLGSTTFSKAVQQRCRALQVDHVDAYALLLQRDAAEFERLVDLLVVPETWFFRGGELFPYLARLAAQRPQPFHALSIPCCTGEEPYSLAIALLEAGLDPSRFTIDGVDLHPRFVAAAQRGIYREVSFRQTPDALRQRYFRPVPGGWELDARVRDGVHFRAGNLLDPQCFPSPLPHYDVILCRNLLIYLTAEARHRAVRVLMNLLNPDGLLAVGHAESACVADQPLARCGPEHGFLFRRSGHAVAGVSERVSFAAPQGRMPAPRSSATVPDAVARKLPRALPPTPLTPPPVAAAAQAVPATAMEYVRSLADAGQLEAALQQCQELIALLPPTADLYSLLGVIQQSRGQRSDAADAFRRALYLDPRHREALLHAMLLSDLQGDTAQAATLRARLARAEGGGEA